MEVVKQQKRSALSLQAVQLINPCAVLMVKVVVVLERIVLLL